MNAQVVVVAKENLATTIESIESLLKATPGVRIIAIDNASKDPEVFKYLSCDAEICVRNNAQVSLAQAWNQGVHLSTADVVVITNNDILYAPGWLPPIVEGLKDFGIGILQPKNTLSTLPAGFPDNYQLQDRIGEIPREDFVGCCFGFRHRLYDCIEREQNEIAEARIGGFDSRFFPFGAEDADFYRMIRRSGHSTVTHFGSYVHHWTGRTMDAIYTREEFEAHKQRANEMFEKKWSAIIEPV